MVSFPAPPEGLRWEITADHYQRQVCVQLCNLEWPDTKVGQEVRAHLHWDDEKIREDVAKCMTEILTRNAFRDHVNAFLQELQAEANAERA